MDDNDYETVVSVLQHMVEDAPEKIKVRISYQGM